jgi:hypothetical protein
METIRRILQRSKNNKPQEAGRALRFSTLLLLLTFPFSLSAEGINITQRLDAAGVPFEERELFLQYGRFRNVYTRFLTV